MNKGILLLAAALSTLLLAGCGGGGTSTGVTGTVISQLDNNPLSGVSVTAGSTGRSTTTDSNGAFSIGGLTAGQITLRFNKTGFEQINPQVTLEAGPNLAGQFIMPTTAPIGGQPGTIHGKVTLTGTADYSDVAVEAFDTANDSWGQPTLTETDGSYSMWLPSGDYRLNFSKAGYASVDTNVTISTSNSLSNPAVVPTVTLHP